MSSCKVLIDLLEYDGEYSIEDEVIKVDVFNYSSDAMAISIGSPIKYKSITICDRKNKLFLYSPAFYSMGITWGRTQYEKFQTDYFFETDSYEDILSLSEVTQFKEITLYHPMLIQYFTNPCVQIKANTDAIDYHLNLKSDKKVLQINNNNIDKLEFGGTLSCFSKNFNTVINVETENYASIILEFSVVQEELLKYIKEFDVYINTYYPTGLRSYKTIASTVDNQSFNLHHKLLGKERYYKRPARKLINLDIFEYLEKMYKCINYRESDDRNKYVLMDFKKPTSMEDQYTYYFRYIDLFMGECLELSTGNRPNNYERLSAFVDKNLELFDLEDISNLENFKNELNSLRNHYVHEGYYLPNGEFEVKRNRKLLYKKHWIINGYFE